MSQQTENERIKILRLELKFAQGDFANDRTKTRLLL
jgi:hypothetical protein